ncbi:hypothetical protein RvY_07991 [Ramazzottius varieornatus]|uniref:G-protein coupled receptors family 1 profile domain-containing protein n=1 Tax=Ramazzottius varieornatus TaxID=947166 RepID=A0A1D1V4B9_RAMVA|nr:hypothetical protein RvY_07991 [Ramazzottius varieornatus]
MAFSLERLATFRFRTWRHQLRAHWKSTLLLITLFFFLSALMDSGILVWYYDSWEGDKHVDNYVQPEWIASWIRHQQKLNIAFPIIVTIILFASNAYLFTYLKAQLKISRSLRKEHGRTAEKASGTPEVSSPSSVKPIRKKPCRMLLACVLLYFLTQGPNVILNTLDHFSNAPYCYHIIEAQNIWEPLSTTLALANYSGNFYVYVLMSSTYRTALKDSFRRRTSPLFRPAHTGRRKGERETTDPGNGHLERRHSQRKMHLSLHTDFDRMSLLSHISVLFSASRRTSAESSKQRPRKRSHSSNGFLVDKREAIPLTPLGDIVSEDYAQSQSKGPPKSLSSKRL